MVIWPPLIMFAKIWTRIKIHSLPITFELKFHSNRGIVHEGEPFRDRVPIDCRRLSNATKGTKKGDGWKMWNRPRSRRIRERSLNRRDPDAIFSTIGSAFREIDAIFVETVIRIRDRSIELRVATAPPIDECTLRKVQLAGKVLARKLLHAVGTVTACEDNLYFGESARENEAALSFISGSLGDILYPFSGFFEMFFFRAL